jgi:hypothetical protein
MIPINFHTGDSKVFSVSISRQTFSFLLSPDYTGLGSIHSKRHHLFIPKPELMLTGQAQILKGGSVLG